MTPAPASANPFNEFRRDLTLADGSEVQYFSLPALAEAGRVDLDRLPACIKVLLEAAMRTCDGLGVTAEAVEALADWQPTAAERPEIAFKPARVVLQDFTGVPCIVDLAALRSAMVRAGKDPNKIEPRIQVDLVIDHSVQVDHFGMADALAFNIEREFERNRERYEFLRWGQDAFETLRIIPPGVGIVHQVNLEFLASGVTTAEHGGRLTAFPDSLVGTDSHTTMINGLGIVGWGVGGIEAEAVMLGQPIYILSPEVVGFELTGRMREGVTATDLTLTVVEMLRAHGVVAKFVEFFGAGASAISLADRATIANMAPEYGATMGFFPVDDESLRYLRTTGRSEAQVDLVERYCKAQSLFRTDGAPRPDYSDVLKLDLGDVETSMAGPKRPQDRILLDDIKTDFNKSLSAPVGPRGFGLDAERLAATGKYDTNGKSEKLAHGAVVIAAITSCTNTSNPSVMLGAGLVAKKAVERGLKVHPWVKTSLAPGSRVVNDYLTKSGLIEPLNTLGFNIVGYGCTTCIGNSGPLPDAVTAAINDGDLIASAVLSGNRNFEGRVNPMTQANYLASPPLVVAFALAGTVDIDLRTEPLGKGSDGEDVYLKDLWPTNEEIAQVLEAAGDPEAYRRLYADVRTANPQWNEIAVGGGDVYDWNPDSTYIQEPPFFVDFPDEPAPVRDIEDARVLVVLGDSTTTDHISPAGSIAADSPAGDYLTSHEVERDSFNSYGSRRGNHEVMMRGTFANIRIKNRMVPGVEGGVTRHLPGGEQMPIYDAAMRYAAEGVPLVVIAGKEYGTGSSRDWAAKGTKLLGVRAVLAESYERIHRSNLVGMGVAPLQFKDGENAESLGLTGEETLTITGLAATSGPGDGGAGSGDGSGNGGGSGAGDGAASGGLRPRQDVQIIATAPDGSKIEFSATLRVDTPIEIEYFKNGGILDYVLREYMKG